MGIVSKGFVGLLLWLALGFAFTEMATIALNAWLMRPSQNPHIETVAASQSGTSN
jgi:hypothetical protein